MDIERVKRGVVILAVATVVGYVTGCGKEPETEGDPVVAQQSPGTATSADAQLSAPASDIIARLKVRIEKGTTSKIRVRDRELHAADPNEMLATLALYERDPNKYVRERAIRYVARLATLHPTPSIKREVVRRLVRSSYDDLAGGGGNYLMGFQARDFDEPSKDLVRQAMSKDPVSVLTIKLAGIANLKDTLPRLEELSVKKPPDFNDFSPDAELSPQQKRRLVALRKEAYARSQPTDQWYHDKCWDAKLARARMGVTKDIVRCIELAESIEDYPVERKLGGAYSDEEIELCRQWMADRANWKIIR